MIPVATAERVAAARTEIGGAPGHARIGVIRSGSRSVVNRAYATSPLRLLMPANHGRAAWIYSSSFGGGLVAGDRIAIDIDVDEAAAETRAVDPRGTAVVGRHQQPERTR